MKFDAYTREERDAVMEASFRAGVTITELATRWEVSHQRISQILAKRGVTRQDGGVHVQAQRNRAARAQRLLEAGNSRTQVSLGCSREERDAIPLRAVKAYSVQKANAKARHIPWTLTLTDWWACWWRSGRFEKRGRYGDSYVLTRKDRSRGFHKDNVAVMSFKRAAALRRHVTDPVVLN